MSWLNPTGHTDPQSKWTNEDKAYDGTVLVPNLSTYANNAGGDGGGDNWLYLTIPAIAYCDKVRVYGTKNVAQDMPAFTLEVSNDDWITSEILAANEVCAGAEWVEYAVSSKNVNLPAARLKQQSIWDNYRIYGFQFHAMERRVVISSSE